jgi:hypothetical protein
MMIGIGIPISQRSAPRIVASERQVELGNLTLPKVGGFRCGGSLDIVHLRFIFLLQLGYRYNRFSPQSQQ